jgi:hypothetical protein
LPGGHGSFLAPGRSAERSLCHWLLQSLAFTFPQAIIKHRVAILGRHPPSDNTILNALVELGALGGGRTALQRDVRDPDRKALTRAPLRDFTRRLNNFGEAAALISHMDVVIPVDTSIAHLAGALGKPTWVLLAFHPDLRWLRDRADSPWYPTARLFRQSCEGAWPDVLQQLATALQNP